MTTTVILNESTSFHQYDGIWNHELNFRIFRINSFETAVSPIIDCLHGSGKGKTTFPAAQHIPRV